MKRDQMPLVGAGTWLLPEELAKTVQNTVTNECAPLYLWMTEGSQRKDESE